MQKTIESSEVASEIYHLVKNLNTCRHEYYNLSAPSISDAVYDHLYDRLSELEQSYGIIFGNSPTQTVGYHPVSDLEKVHHTIPLLSLDKTKLVQEIYEKTQLQDTLLMLKLDGLTIKLCYDNGQLTEASTRGDGEEGELITHNIPAFQNVPLKIPYKKPLSITGEGFMYRSDFERLRQTLLDSSGKPYKNSRNLASGSARSLDPLTCKDRCVHFLAFNVLEGLEEYEDSDKRENLLQILRNFGFGICPFIPVTTSIAKNELEAKMAFLQTAAEQQDIPIDGLVIRYNSISYSKALGHTGHHYRDGVAYKFADDTYETVFRTIRWAPSRSGEIAPTAIFDTISIDGCDVSRASLHNLSFIKDLELYPGCRILVSKRNMIIPHIEDNMERGHYRDMIPKRCPCCGRETRVFARGGEKERMIETLHCDNPDCSNQILRKFMHFAEKKAMNIIGISEATLERFISLGYLKTFIDIYHLDDYKDEIIQLEGFGEKSYKELWTAIQQSRNTNFVRFLVSMDIPMIGRTASREIDSYFAGDLRKFELAAMDYFDFTSLNDFGDIKSKNIHDWFHNSDHILLFRGLQKELNFERKEENIMSENDNVFTGCTIVATGKLQNFTRDSINSKIISLGATVGSAVTAKTNYLICGEKAGSKLSKAQQLGVTVLTEQQFLDMLSA